MGVYNKTVKIVLAAALFFIVPSVIYFFFIVTLPSAVARPYAKTLFVILFSTWFLLEIILCVSIKVSNGNNALNNIHALNDLYYHYISAIVIAR